MLLAGLLLGLATNAIDTPVIEGVEVTQSIDYYVIRGDTSRKMLADMERQGPGVLMSGRRGYARTQTDLNWTYDYTPLGNGTCRIRDSNVRLDIKIVLPHWQPDREPKRKLSDQWQAFSTALTAHELGHRAIGLHAARAVVDAIRGLPPAACQDIPRSIEATTSRIMADMEAGNREYDIRTEHGRTEGAWWVAR